MSSPKLTISVLISRNYEGVKKCLDSLKPILEKVSSELILTDTGCGNKVKKLIEEYTDNIIDFEWIKDFSAARNVGLKAAKGEWFLYVDDDEWFDDVTELVSFFNSNECDRYNVATYIQRNYLDIDGTKHADHIVDRIIRITPELHFEHRVHEAYTGIDIGKKKKLSTFVHHYGYVYKSEEERIEKSKRNRELLELECKEYPEDMRIRHQLMMDYYSLNQYDEAIKCALEGIKIKSDSMYWDALHTDLLFCLQAQQKWDKLIEYGERFLKSNLFPFDEFGVKQYLISAYWGLGKHEKVCEYATIVINTYIDYKKNPDKYDANQLMREEFWQSSNIKKMLLFIINSAVVTENSTVIDKLQSYDIKDELMGIIYEDSFRTFLMQMTLTGCSNVTQIEMFYKLPVAGAINTVNLEQFVNQINEMFPYIALDKFDMWKNWIFSKVKEENDKKAFFLAKCNDYVLRSIRFHIEGMDQYNSLEYVLGNMTEYADNEINYCEAKYGNELLDMTEEDILPEELLAWKIQELINQVDYGDAEKALDTVRIIRDLAPYWSDAIPFLPTYIQLVMG